MNINVLFRHSNRQQNSQSNRDLRNGTHARGGAGAGIAVFDLADLVTAIAVDEVALALVAGFSTLN